MQYYWKGIVSKTFLHRTLSRENGTSSEIKWKIINKPFFRISYFKKSQHTRALTICANTPRTASRLNASCRCLSMLRLLPQSVAWRLCSLLVLVVLWPILIWLILLQLRELLLLLLQSPFLHLLLLLLLLRHLLILPLRLLFIAVLYSYLLLPASS